VGQRVGRGAAHESLNELILNSQLVRSAPMNFKFQYFPSSLRRHRCTSSASLAGVKGYSIRLDCKNAFCN
jgi:hypothetical protein